MADEYDQIDQPAVAPELAYNAKLREPQNDLLSLITAIAGLGANVAGIATRSGAHGQDLLNFSEKRSKQVADQAAFKGKAESDARVLGASSDALASMLPQFQAQAAAALKEGDRAGFERLQRMDIAEKNAYTNQGFREQMVNTGKGNLQLHQKADARAEKRDAAQEAIAGLDDDLKVLGSSLKGHEATKNQAIQDVLANNDWSTGVHVDKGIFLDRIKKAIGADSKNGAEEFKKVQEYVDSKRQGGFEIPGVSKVIGPVLQTLPKEKSPAEVFSDFAKTRTSPEARQQYEDLKLQQMAAQAIKGHARSPNARALRQDYDSAKNLLSTGNPQVQKAARERFKKIIGFAGQK